MLARATAAHLLDALMAGEAPTIDERGPAARAQAYRSSLEDGRVEESARMLAAAYNHPDPSYAEQEFIPALERAVIREIAVALHDDERRLRAEIRNAVLGEPVPAFLQLPDRSAELAGRRAIYVEEALNVGGRVFRARQGVWLVDGDSIAHHRPRGEHQIVRASAIFEACLESDAHFRAAMSSSSPGAIVEGRGLKLTQERDVKLMFEGEILVAITT
jgi:hypothetical protein